MKLCIWWCEFAYNGILTWSLLLTRLHYMFYSLQLILHACLRKSSDLMLDVAAGIYWVLANIALVIATTLRDLEQRREISHTDILPHRSFMPAKASCLCSYHWCVMLTRKTIAISHVLYHCMVIYLFASLNITCLLQDFASQKPCTEYDHYSCIQT